MNVVLLNRTSPNFLMVRKVWVIIGEVEHTSERVRKSSEQSGGAEGLWKSAEWGGNAEELQRSAELSVP